MREKFSKDVKRIVVKLGTSILTSKKANRLDAHLIKCIVGQICRLLDRKIEVILVTSGAIGAGMGLLNLGQRPKLLPGLQAAAAIGQSQLMKLYDSFFKQRKRLTAQILLTAEDLNQRQRYLNARNTISTLLDYKATPIINENDTVSVDEIKFGDNDTLASHVANLVDADLLIILSDVDGLYSSPTDRPEQKILIDTVEEIGPEITKLASGPQAEITIGGMKTKVQAAKTVTSSGIPMVIANGRVEDVLIRIIDGHMIGTLFLPKATKLGARKRWIAYSTMPKGRVIVDNGAKEALIKKGKSLLASGVMEVAGKFKIGDVVGVVDEQDREFARGLINYSKDEVAKIKGLKTHEIESKLGYKYYDELIHWGNLVIL